MSTGVPLAEWDGVGPVPDLWDWRDGVPMVGFDGTVSGRYVRAVASWSRQNEDIAPTVMLLADHGAFSFSGRFKSRDARALAADLLRAADLVDAHRLALSVEKSFKDQQAEVES